MICKFCGKEIPENSEYCEYCNESLIDKIVLDDKALVRAKENRRKEESPIFVRAYYKAKESAEEKKLRQERELQEAANGGKKPAKVYTGEPFYKQRKARIIAIVLSFLPVLMIVLSYFLNWMYMWVQLRDKISLSKSMKNILAASLHKDTITGRTEKMTFANYVPLICLILMIIAALYILYLAMLDLFPDKKIPKEFLVKKQPLIARIVPVVLLVAAFYIFTHCKMYVNAQEALDNVKKGYSTFAGFDESKNAGSGKGLGYVLAILSPIIYVGSKIYVFVINTLNEED